MRIREYIQNNPFRGLGVAVSDSPATLSSNSSRLKAYAAIGKPVSFPMDLDILFGGAPDRSKSSLDSYIASLSVPSERLRHGLLWFMNITGTDAAALEEIRHTGDLLQARKIWENGEQNMSALQNQMVCCILMDPRSYSKAIQLASQLYGFYGEDIIKVLGNGFNIISQDRLMPMLFEEIIVHAGDELPSFDKAVKRSAIKDIEGVWTEAKVEFLIGRIQQAFNIAKSSECRTNKDHYDIAYRLMKQTEPDIKTLKALSESNSILLSRYSTIAETVGEFILDNEIEYYNHSYWSHGLIDRTLELERFCYRHASTVRFKDRCLQCINITMGRKEDAPLFPNGTPDNLTSESERVKRNAGICAILSGLENVTGH